MSMNKIQLLYYSLISIVLAGCADSSTVNKEKSDPIAEVEHMNFDWIIGQWKYEDVEGILFEDWKKENDSTFMGKSYYVNESDTLFVESILLSRIGDSLFYESLKEDTLRNKIYKGPLNANNSFTIENPQHGFPRNIRYNYLTDSSMVIEISGVIDGQMEIQPYEMVRVNSTKE